MMVFVSDDLTITSELRQQFETAYRSIVDREGIVIDTEVPFGSKQLVLMSCVWYRYLCSQWRCTHREIPKAFKLWGDA
jgi:hypothetical protein